MKYENEILTGDVTLDGNEFHGCTFRDCSLHYAGGHFEIRGPSAYDNVQYVFDGMAGCALRFLQALHASPDGPGMIRRLLERTDAAASARPH